jgi:hypothetical protein
LRSGGDKRRLRGLKNAVGRAQCAGNALCAFFCARIFAPLETYGFLYCGAKTPQTFLLCAMH